MTFRATFEHRDELLGAAVAEFDNRGDESAAVNRLPELLDLEQPADLETRIDEVLAFLGGGLGRP
jgi:hypothetical protein